MFNELKDAIDKIVDDYRLGSTDAGIQSRECTQSMADIYAGTPYGTLLDKRARREDR